MCLVYFIQMKLHLEKFDMKHNFQDKFRQLVALRMFYIYLQNRNVHLRFYHCKLRVVQAILD